jgi:hypothetical protein
MGLLSELSVIGYDIFLQGENIRLQYQKPDTPPETARRLIDELKRCKAEAVNILKTSNTITPAEKTQPETNTKAVWPPDAHELINWFMELETPAEPFYLESHIYVHDPEKFFVSLRQEIAIGPASPRGRNGVLLHDLNILRKNLH